MPNETFGPQNTRTVIIKVCASSNNPKLGHISMYQFNGRRGNFEMRSGGGVGGGPDRRQGGESKE